MKPPAKDDRRPAKKLKKHNPYVPLPLPRLSNHLVHLHLSDITIHTHMAPMVRHHRQSMVLLRTDIRVRVRIHKERMVRRQPMVSMATTDILSYLPLLHHNRWLILPWRIRLPLWTQPKMPLSIACLRQQLK